MDVFSIGSAVHFLSEIFWAQCDAALLNGRGLKHFASPLLLGCSEAIVLGNSPQYLAGSPTQSPNDSSKVAFPHVGKWSESTSSWV